MSWRPCDVPWSVLGRGVGRGLGGGWPRRVQTVRRKASRDPQHGPGKDMHRHQGGHAASGKSRPKHPQPCRPEGDQLKQPVARRIRRPGLLSMRVSRLTSTRKRQLKKLPRQAKGRRIENLTLRVRLEWAGEDCRPGALTRRTDVRHPRRRVRARGLQHGRSVELQRRVWLIPSPSAVFRLMRHHARTPPAGPVAGGPRTRRWPRNWRD